MTRYLIFCALIVACQTPQGAEAPAAMLMRPALLEQGAKSPARDEASIFGRKKKKPSTVGNACSQSKLSCDPAQFCDLKTEGSSCSAATSGSCTEKPSVCTRDYRPVCGCDGVTWWNADAAKARTLPPRSVVSQL